MKKKYLIIDAKDIKKKIFIQYRNPIIDGFDNWYIIKEKVEVKTYFDKKEIPEEYQKLILQVTSPIILFEADAEELFFEKPYDLKRDVTSKKTMTGKQSSMLYDDTLISGNLSFETNIDYKETDEVIDFINRLEASGYIEEYLEVLKELSRVEITSRLPISKLFEKEETKQRARKRTNN